MEEERVRRIYALSERTLRRLVSEARRESPSGPTKLVELLECRLENVVFRAGLATTVTAARQLVAHRCIRLNGRIVNAPSRRLRAGDLVTLRPGSCAGTAVAPRAERPGWIALDAKGQARVSRSPAEADLSLQIDVGRLL